MDGYNKTQENKLNIIDENKVVQVRAIDENFQILEDVIGSVSGVDLDGFNSDSQFGSKKSLVNFIKFIWKKLNAIELTDTKVNVTTDGNKLLSVVLGEIKSNASSLLENINRNKTSIGLLSSLKTKEKTNIISAVNEVNDKVSLVTNDNLLDGSSNEWNVLEITDGQNTKRYIRGLGKLSLDNFNIGDKITVSCVIEYSGLQYSSSNLTFALRSPGDITNWSNSMHITGNINNQTGLLYFSRTITIDSNNLQNKNYNAFEIGLSEVSGGTFKVKNLKIERGEVATHWKPSTNDLVDLRTNVDVLTKKITLNNTELNRLNREFRALNGGA